MQKWLKEAGLPHRIIAFVFSVALADDAAEGRKADRIKVAVHRGHEAMMPKLGIAMCRDLEMVRMATSSGLPVFSNACLWRGGASCHNLDHCAKQQNLHEAERANVVLAAHDSFYTWLAVDPKKVA